MIKKIKAEDRFKNEISWLKTYWLFSFDHYYDPENINFGVLRVFNDDIIKAKNGFPLHPHKDMEILTFVFKGELTHEDSIGNKGEIKAYELQRMNAGEGVYHSEYNYGDEDVQLYQIWFYSNKRLKNPEYNSVKIDGFGKNRKNFIASLDSEDASMKLNADVDIYFFHYDKGKKEKLNIKKKKLFIYIKEGKVKINGIEFGKGDQARVEYIKDVEFDFQEETELIFMELGDFE